MEWSHVCVQILSSNEWIKLMTLHTYMYVATKSGQVKWNILCLNKSVIIQKSNHSLQKEACTYVSYVCTFFLEDSILD